MSATVSSLAASPQSDPHWDLRVDLACAFRWAERYNWHEGVANHFSLSVSDDGRTFLMNPNLRHFKRIKASDLILIDADDPSTLDRPDAPDATAWGLHGALHRQVPQARCAIHLHPHYATALACLEDPSMPPIDQNSARFYNRLSIDTAFGGMALDDEAERCVSMLGQNKVLLMGQHGVMTVGGSVAEAFDAMYYFEQSARTLMTAYASGRPVKVLDGQVAEVTARQWENEISSSAESHFRELQAILDVEDPDYRT